MVGVDVVVVRILGGFRAWEDGIDAVLASGVPAVVVSGEQAPDAELMDRSNVPAGIALQTHVYLAQGRHGKPCQPSFLPERHRADDRLRVRAAGDPSQLGRPSNGRRRMTTGRMLTARPSQCSSTRAQQLAGNTAYVESLCQAIESTGGRALPLYCASLRTPAAELLDTLAGADAMVVTVLAAGGAVPATVGAGG